MDDKIHNIILENRKKISISAVLEIASFDESEVIIKIYGSCVTIKGSGLKVEELSVESGDAQIVGERIDSIIYTKGSSDKNREGFLGRLLK